MSEHVCEPCGESFATLTALRLHEKDDCDGRAVYDDLDPEDDATPARGAEGLLTCRRCDRVNPNTDFEETTDFAGSDFHMIVEFECGFCGFENENRLVMTGVDSADLDDLPPHLRPEGSDE